MAGMFDDLIPAQNTPSGGMFDDLIPTTQSGSWMDYGEGIAEKAAQGATAHVAPHIAAAAGAGGNWLARKLGLDIPEKNYQGILDEIRGKEKVFTEANPKTAVAAELGGTIAGPGRAGARFIARAPSFLGGVMRAGVISAPYGAVSEASDVADTRASPEDVGTAMAKGGATSAAAGALFQGAGQTVGRVVGPWATAAAQRLSDRGIRLTPGELLGGYAKRAEDIGSSIPFVGALIRNRRQAGIEDLNRVVANETLEPIGAQVAQDAPAGRDLVRAVGDEISNVYRQTVPRLAGQIDLPLQRQLATIENSLPQNIRPDFNRFVHQENLHEVSGGGARGAAISGEDMQHLIGVMRAEATHLTASGTSSHQDRALGRAFGRAADAFVENMGRHSPADAAEAFRNANAAFERLVRLERAAGAVGSQEGVFTPSTFLNAVKQTDRSARKRAFARGDARMQDIADDAKTVMAQQVANSGTPERAALMGAILVPSIAMKTVAPAAGVGALYTPWGTAAFRHMATMSPAARMRARRLIELATALGAPGAGQEFSKSGLFGLGAQ